MNISIGDRREVDIEPAQAIGMEGIWIKAAEDIYVVDRKIEEIEKEKKKGKKKSVIPKENQSIKELRAYIKEVSSSLHAYAEREKPKDYARRCEIANMTLAGLLEEKFGAQYEVIVCKAEYFWRKIQIANKNIQACNSGILVTCAY